MDSGLTDHDQQILAQISKMPDTAKVSVKVAAFHEGVSEKSIRRHYPIVKSGTKNFVRVGDLRKGRPATAA
jgi:hypothetical protein